MNLKVAIFDVHVSIKICFKNKLTIRKILDCVWHFIRITVIRNLLNFEVAVKIQSTKFIWTIEYPPICISGGQSFIFFHKDVKDAKDSWKAVK